MDYAENCSDDDAFSSRLGDVMMKNRYLGDVAPADEVKDGRTTNTFLRQNGEKELRKLACLTGVPDARRRAIWMKLLGIEFGLISQVQFATNERECDETLSRTISADCERSYFNLENEKELQNEKRKELERLLRSVFGGKNRLRYYQGVHAVTQVVLSIAETEEEEEDANAKYKISCAMLDRLASFSLRDNTRETMYPVLLSLRIVLARLIEEALGEDEVLKEAIAFGARKHEYQFALQKVLTWHSMSADSSKRSVENSSEKEEEESRNECVKRVFDLFLASHPLMPVYLTVAVLLRERESIIKARNELDDDDDDVMFSYLSRLETFPDLTSYVENDDENSGTIRRNGISEEDIDEAKNGSEHEKKKKMKQMMQKVRSVSFGSSSSLANMSPRKRLKKKRLQKRQLQAVDALCHSALKLFNEFPPTQILRANEMKTTFNGSSFDPKRYPPRFAFSKLASPTPPHNEDNNTTDELDIHFGEQIEIKKAARLKRLRLAQRKLFACRRRVHALPLVLKMILFLLVYVQYWENVRIIHYQLAYGPDIRISLARPRWWFGELFRALLTRLFAL
jgi:hypothetical protein